MRRDIGSMIGQSFSGTSGRFYKGSKSAFSGSVQAGLRMTLFVVMMVNLSQLMAQGPVEPFLVKSGSFEVKGPHLEQLYFGANPSVYITGGQITTAGSGTPLTLFCEPGSVSRLYESHPVFQGVELIQFSIESANDLLMTLDLKGLEQFSNLKHISFVFGFDACGNKTHDCLKEQVKKILQGQETSLGITYQLSIPE